MNKKPENSRRCQYHISNHVKFQSPKKLFYHYDWNNAVAYRQRLGICLKCKSKRENAEIKLGIEKNEKRKRGDEERHKRVEKPCVKINEYIDFMCLNKFLTVCI